MKNLNLIIEIIEIIRKNISIQEIDEFKDYNESLLEKGMDSINLINIIVDIENKYNIIFPDSKLSINYLDTINKIAFLVDELI